MPEEKVVNRTQEHIVETVKVIPQIRGGRGGESLREALHIRNVEGFSLACISAHVDVGNLSPATISTITAVRAGERHEDHAQLSREIHAKSTQRVKENAKHDPYWH